MIVERLKPRRPIEVINAGIPAFSIKENHRLTADLLPVDRIIPYHGYNGFHLIEGALPLTYAKAPPTYQPRPLKLLADCEYRWKMFLYRRREFVRLPRIPRRLQMRCKPNTRRATGG